MESILDRLTAALADRYRIQRELGQGGMATVYLAEDLKHDRKVALKVLKPELAAVLGAERFVVEIKTTASLQHPHILPLFDSGTADGFLFYVMPYIEGETLRGKLDRETQLGVDEAVRIASDVASALHYAHTHGVIHRDIKPENILLHDGRPMVADFGIALAVSAAAGGRMTETGLSLGTPHYMSPEQATAEKEITGRSDVYSLGSVLYEMLTGDPPHTGSSAQQIIMKIITEPADPVTRVRKSVPPNVAAAVGKALVKLPADRFESAKAFAEALANPAFRTEASLAGAPGAPGGARVEAHWKRSAAILGVTTLAFGALAAWALLRPDMTVREVGLLPTAPIHLAASFRSFSVSHDGSFVVYVARADGATQLWLRALRGSETRPIAGTEGAVGAPILSPDDKRVAFQAGSDLKVVALDGGPATTFAQVQDPHGAEWLADGRIVLGDQDGRLVRWIDVATGATREIESFYCLHPQLIDDDHALCGGGAQKYAALIDLRQPLRKPAFRQVREGAGSGPQFLLGSHFRLVDERYLVYMALDGKLMGTRILDRDSLTVGRSVPLTPNIRRSAYSGVGQYTISNDGTLTYVPGLNADIGRLVRVARNGRLDSLRVDAAAFLRFTPSPDGRRLAGVVEGTQHQEMRVYDLESGTHETYDTGFYLGAAAWSPDGRSLAYVKQDDPDRERVLLRRLDAPGAPRLLATVEPAEGAQVSQFISPSTIVVGTAGQKVGMLVIDAAASPATIDSVPVVGLFASISPDRRWIVHQANGVTGVILQPWPARDRRYLVDADGSEPRWSLTNEIGYLSHYKTAGVTAASMYRVRIDPGAASPVGRREQVARDSRFNDTPGWSHAFTSAGELIYVQAPAENLGYYLRVVPGFVQEMKRAVDEANR